MQFYSSNNIFLIYYCTLYFIFIMSRSWCTG